ncbi:uncharacterized protein LOC110602057 [Manihot esculenta]|uniref:uncharacterized protein LOC110602057 n=1 Tax=Manihot esculenta TaxID=3983 RepID=UPI000B5D3FD6|nr:uncharacterized protein LOC110602057 [Manihot esculenta]
MVGGLGYRDLQQFNLALVAKRRIRDGRSTHIWIDPWILEASDPYIRTEVFENMPFIMVFNLILNRTWNANLIRTHFQQHDSDNILHIPLSLRESDDDWCWALNRKSEYVVKEGYHVAMKDTLAYVSDHSFPWNLTSKVVVPAKVELLIWRILQNALPCKHNLRVRHVDTDECGPIFCIGLETDFHVLHRCSFTRSYWLLSNFGWVSFPFLNTMLPYILTSLPMSQGEEVFMLIWSLWTHYNDVIWN